MTCIIEKKAIVQTKKEKGRDTIVAKKLKISKAFTLEIRTVDLCCSGKITLFQKESGSGTKPYRSETSVSKSQISHLISHVNLI